jgi:hypothetical protein
MVYRRHGQRVKSGRGRVRGDFRHEACVTACRTPQQCFERCPPPWRKGLDSQGAFQRFARMIWRIEKRIDLCDGHALLRFADLHDLVTGAHFAFVDDTEVEAGTAAGGEQGRHARLVRPNADAIAGNAGLRNFEERAADPKPVADAHRIVCESFDGEVLAELSAGARVAEARPLQLFLPITIRLDLVNEDGSMFTPVAGQIALPVSFEIQTADAAAARHWILPDPGAHGAPFPFDLAWQADVHRQ